MLFAEFSPIHHLKDSTMLDFPHPLGPTIPVKPSSIKKVVLSENDLNHIEMESKLKIENILSAVRKDDSPKSENFREFIFN